MWCAKAKYPTFTIDIVDRIIKLEHGKGYRPGLSDIFLAIGRFGVGPAARDDVVERAITRNEWNFEHDSLDSQSDEIISVIFSIAKGV